VAFDEVTKRLMRGKAHFIACLAQSHAQGDIGLNITEGAYGKDNYIQGLLLASEAPLVAMSHNLLKLWRSGKAAWGWSTARWN